MIYLNTIVSEVKLCRLNSMEFFPNLCRQVRHDFVTFQMYLFEEKLKAENRGKEEAAIKLIRRGRPLQEITKIPDYLSNILSNSLEIMNKNF